MSAADTAVCDSCFVIIQHFTA